MIWRTHLCKVFADVLSSVAQIMTERTGITSLTSTLTKELARNVGRIYNSVVSVGTTFGIQGLAGVVCNMQQPRSKAKQQWMNRTYSGDFGVHRSGEYLP